MEPDLNGINSSDTTFRLDNSTIREEWFLISKITRMKMVNTLELINPILEEFNRDGSSNMLTKWQMNLSQEPDPEDLKLEDLSISNQDCGCRELLLITLITMHTPPQSRLIKRQTIDNSGYTMKFPRQSSHSMKRKTKRTIREYLIAEAPTSLFKILTQDGIKCGLILLMDIFTLTNHLVLTKNGKLPFKQRLIQK